MIAQIGLYAGCVIVYSFVRIRALLRKGHKGAAALYAGLMAICLVLGSIFIAGIHLPSLVVPYQILFEPIGKAIIKE